MFLSEQLVLAQKLDSIASTVMIRRPAFAITEILSISDNDNAQLDDIFTAKSEMFELQGESDCSSQNVPTLSHEAFRMFLDVPTPEHDGSMLTSIHSL